VLQSGIVAPEFSLQDQDGKTRSLADFLGSWVLLYFYPKDETPGCTEEACAIRDAWTDFQEAGVIVLGVSHDSVESHKKFAQNHRLPFLLLADPKKDVIKLYKSEAGFLTRRTSYLIDPEGKIAKTYPSVEPAEHAAEILQDVRNLTIDG
jgi:peroxiredoxin Q/BCP